MKNAILVLFFLLSGTSVFAQATRKTGVYKSYDDYLENTSAAGDFILVPFIRINKIDPAFNDTLYKLNMKGEEKHKMFGVYNGEKLYVNTEDSLYRKMDFIGRYPFVTIINKIHMPEGFVIVNKTPIWKEERDEVFTYIAFVNKQGKLVAADFETMWAFLKGNKDLADKFGKEKHVTETYWKYLVLMNERHPL